MWNEEYEGGDEERQLKEAMATRLDRLYGNAPGAGSYGEGRTMKTEKAKLWRLVLPSRMVHGMLVFVEIRVRCPGIVNISKKRGELVSAAYGFVRLIANVQRYLRYRPLNLLLYERQKLRERPAPLGRA